MGTYEIILLALALGTDAFSVAVVLGSRAFNYKKLLQFSGITGLFHILMPLAGLLSAYIFKQILNNYFRIYREFEYLFELLGAGILLLLGFYFILESFLNSDSKINEYSQTFSGLCILSFSLSLDAYAVGLSLGFIEFSMILVLIIGVTAFMMMGTGLYLGAVLNYHLPFNTQPWGGAVLIFMGLRFMGLL